MVNNIHLGYIVLSSNDHLIKSNIFSTNFGGAVVVVILWLLDLQLPVQSVPITTKVSSNPAHGEMNSIQRYVSSTNKTDRQNITEI
jgi:hypothetical protein